MIFVGGEKHVKCFYERNGRVAVSGKRMKPLVVRLSRTNHSVEEVHKRGFLVNGFILPPLDEIKS